VYKPWAFGRDLQAITGHGGASTRLDAQLKTIDELLALAIPQTLYVQAGQPRVGLRGVFTLARLG
jgi:hypothetical protein